MNRRVGRSSMSGSLRQGMSTPGLPQQAPRSLAAWSPPQYPQVCDDYG